ncbi:MAG: Cytosolic seryl-tRNA synthetase [Trizodia sp. TS-e1964]|nr:MAG: Cytosolic seryl-tRNA synthetase [Trizodia sp. TS-e1964]
MLDVQDFITERGGEPEKIRESQRKRHAPVELVDEIIELYEVHRRTKYGASQISTKINAVQKEIGAKKKAKEDASELLQKKADLEKEKKSEEESAAEKELVLQAKIKRIGNYVHASVPTSNTEVIMTHCILPAFLLSSFKDDNAFIRGWSLETGIVDSEQAIKAEKLSCLTHHEVLARIDGYDPERGVKVQGHSGVFIKNWGARLIRALVDYGLDFLADRDYDEIDTPHMMLKKPMEKTCQLSEFEETLYHISEEVEQNEKYLIATSEQPISAMHDGEWIREKELPIRSLALVPFLTTLSNHHIDMLATAPVTERRLVLTEKMLGGSFEHINLSSSERLSNIAKIEQFLITEPEKSWEEFEKMITVSEEFYQSLGLPYRIVAIVSAALNNAAAKKYDLEAWFPFEGKFKELVSCSNCTDYQSRALEVRCGTKSQTDARKKYVHMLNCTLTATGRTLCCIMENYQTEEGLRIPEVLRPYLRGSPEFIPFTKELSKDSTSQRAKAKPEKGSVSVGKVATPMAVISIETGTQFANLTVQ